MRFIIWTLVFLVTAALCVFAIAARRVYRGTDRATRDGLNIKVKVGETVVAVKQSITGKQEVIG